MRTYTPRIELSCVTCKAVFSRPPSQTTNGRGKYCSRGCSDSAKNNHTITSCMQCSSEFKLRQIDVARNKQFCSRKCYMESGKHEEALKKANENTPRNYWAGKKRPQMTGENNWNWKGGVGSERHSAMGQVEYKQWRTAVFEKNDYTCQICEQHGGVLHADHIEKWADSEELRYAVDNGRTLCVACHYYITFKKKMRPGQRWCNFTARERG